MSKNVFSISTALFPCVEVSMYESVLSSGKFAEERAAGEGKFVYVVVDDVAWDNQLAECADDYIQERVLPVLTKYGVKAIKGLNISSPKYYNFETDRLEMSVTMKRGWECTMKKYMQNFKNESVLQKYIKDHFCSCSGFISLMPESMEEIVEYALKEESAYNSDKERGLAAYLTLALLYENALDVEHQSMFELAESMNETFTEYSYVNVLEEYYTKVEDAQQLLDLFDNDLKWDMLQWELFDKLGAPWERNKGCEILHGKQEWYFSVSAANSAEKLLFWSAQHGYTVEDLYRMAV